MEGAMPAPAAIIVHCGAERSRNTLQEDLQDLQGKPATRTAISGFTENASCEVSKPRDGEVAVEDLDNKEMDRGDGIEDPPAKAVAHSTADGGDLGGVQDSGNLPLDAPQGGVNVLKHP